MQGPPPMTMGSSPERSEAYRGILRKIQHLKNIGIAHFVLDRDAEKVKILYRILGFQGKQRNVLLPHDLVQICPGRIDAFTPDVFSLIKHIVKNLDAEMGHTDLIDIRETHGKADIYLVLYLSSLS